jgi:hypothetical protein
MWEENGRLFILSHNQRIIRDHKKRQTFLSSSQVTKCDFRLSQGTIFFGTIPREQHFLQ